MTERLDSQSPADKEQRAAALADEIEPQIGTITHVSLSYEERELIVEALRALSARSAGTRIAEGRDAALKEAADIVASEYAGLGLDKERGCRIAEQRIRHLIGRTPQSASERTFEERNDALNDLSGPGDQENMKRLPIVHLGYLSLCDAKHRAENIRRIDLGEERYRQLGVKERFKNEKPYRVCKRCIANLPYGRIRPADSRATRGWKGPQP